MTTIIVGVHTESVQTALRKTESTQIDQEKRFSTLTTIKFNTQRLSSYRKTSNNRITNQKLKRKKTASSGQYDSNIQHFITILWNSAHQRINWLCCMYHNSMQEIFGIRIVFNHRKWSCSQLWLWSRADHLASLQSPPEMRFIFLIIEKGCSYCHHKLFSLQHNCTMH